MSLGASFFEKADIEQLTSKDRQLLQQLWAASDSSSTKVNHCVDEWGNAVSSGYSTLDDLLSQQGWPLGIMTEIGLAQAGIGEVRLLLPALRALQQRSMSKRHILWIAPPFTPLATSLLKEGLDLDYLTIVAADNIEDVVWACEQALLSASCAAVLAWTGRCQLSNKEIRRLQLAAEKSQSLSVLLRDQLCLEQASASHLRLSLQTNTKSELELHILKQPQHWGGQRCTLSLHPHYENWQRLPAELLPHNNAWFTANAKGQADRSDRPQTVASVSPLLNFASIHAEQGDLD